LDRVFIWKKIANRRFLRLPSSVQTMDTLDVILHGFYMINIYILQFYKTIHVHYSLYINDCDLAVSIVLGKSNLVLLCFVLFYFVTNLV
jgi:hypothetical protein